MTGHGSLQARMSKQGGASWMRYATDDKKMQASRCSSHMQGVVNHAGATLCKQQEQAVVSEHARKKEENRGPGKQVQASKQKKAVTKQKKAVAKQKKAVASKHVQGSKSSTPDEAVKRKQKQTGASKQKQPPEGSKQEKEIAACKQ
jgi:hypothetical protein